VAEVDPKEIEEGEKDVEDDVSKKEPDDTASSSFSFSPPSSYDVRQSILGFVDGVKDTWSELLESSRPKSLDMSKNIALPKSHQAVNEEGKYEGSSELLIVSEEDSAWRKAQERLKEAPIIRDVLNAAGKAYNAQGVKKIRDRASDIGEDAREAWETSQNPWVYRLSSVYDTLTAPDEFAIGVQELRRLDSSFDLEEFRLGVETQVGPELVRDYMRGDVKKLKGVCGEVAYRKISEEVRNRKKDGLAFDTNVLGVDNCEVQACQLDPNNKGAPIIVLSFMCQQINCVTKTSSSDSGKPEIVEGAPDDIRANFYMVAMQREFDEEDGNLKWKVVDMSFQPGIAYI